MPHVNVRRRSWRTTTIAALLLAIAVVPPAAAGAEPLPEPPARRTARGPGPTRVAAERVGWPWDGRGSAVGNVPPRPLNRLVTSARPARPGTTTVAAVPRPDDGLPWANGHLGGRKMAIALASAGIDYGTTVDRNDVIAAGHRLGIRFGPALDPYEVWKVRRAAWAFGGRWMTVSGLDFDEPLDPDDIRRIASELGIDIGSQLDAGDVAAVIAAGQARMKEKLSRGGFSFGSAVNTSDLLAAARLYGVDVGSKLEPAEARTIADRVAEEGDPDGTLRFAKVGRVDVYLAGQSPRYVGLHQAAGATVLPMKRWGVAHSDVMPSRGRGTHRASAADQAMLPGESVYAPVSGRVVEVDSYRLYGRYPDVRIRIVPDQDTRMLTTVLHMRGPKVRVGDHVTGGRTVIASSARKFPFWSQIDEFSGGPYGHVHVETRWR